MYKLILLALFALASSAFAQEPADEESTGEETPVVESEDEPFEGLSEEELEELEIGAQQDHTEEDDDVFKPTDAVSYQQSVQFPVDI